MPFDGQHSSSKPHLACISLKSPLANIKKGAADTLRRELIRTEARGCVLRLHAGLARAMLWPCSELEITAFIRAAEAPYALHSQFDEARRLSDRQAGSVF